MLFETVLILSVAFLGFLYFLAKNNKRERIDLLGKHVVITGGSSGIGYDLSLEAVKQGAHVTVIARNKDKLNKIKAVLEEIRQKSGTINSQIIQVESLDISKSFEETKAAFERVSSKSSKLIREKI